MCRLKLSFCYFFIFFCLTQFCAVCRCAVWGTMQPSLPLANGRCKKCFRKSRKRATFLFFLPILCLLSSNFYSCSRICALSWGLIQLNISILFLFVSPHRCAVWAIMQARFAVRKRPLQDVLQEESEAYGLPSFCFMFPCFRFSI